MLDEEKMPGASWFKGANVNIVHEIFKNLEENKDKTAVSFRSETIGDGLLSWRDLESKTNSLVKKLKELGVKKVIALLLYSQTPRIPLLPFVQPLVLEQFGLFARRIWRDCYFRSF